MTVAHSTAPSAHSLQHVVTIPSIEDGSQLFQFVQETGGLDINSEYSYLLLGAHFNQTCALVKHGQDIIGFVSSYLQPNHSDTLFVWQVAVNPQYRKQGLAKMMILNILQRPVCKSVNFLKVSITPDNMGSQKLFAALASELKCNISSSCFFEKSDFSTHHEKELLFHLGPFFQY